MLMLLTLLPPAHVASLACSACGPECANACGTAMFRACCFNYNRKRSIPVQDLENTVTDIAANLSNGNDGNVYTPEIPYGKRELNSLFKQFLADKWLQLSEKNSDRLRGKGRQQYHLGNYLY